MSADSKYLVNFLCYYEPMDKIWGWILPPQYNKTLINQHHSWRNPQIAYAFWAVVGKTISIKSHAYYNKGSMHALERRKINNKYVDMPEELILERWPAFVEQLEQALIFHKLREG